MIHPSFNFHNFPALTSHQNSPLQSQVFSFTFLILITNQAGFHYIILLPTFMPRTRLASTNTTNSRRSHLSYKQSPDGLTSRKAPTQCNVKSSLKVWLLIKILFDNPQHRQSPLLASWPDKVRKLESVISLLMLRTWQTLNNYNIQLLQLKYISILFARGSSPSEPVSFVVVVPYLPGDSALLILLTHRTKPV